MSGIAGIIRFDGAPVEQGWIESLTSAMALRGPDGINQWLSGSIALGHCKLRTAQDSLRETQPLPNHNKSVVLVMDGRLDNRDELRRNLIAQEACLPTGTDAELVLHAYATWGDECPCHLLGDFAFALWDARRQRLFCARDHLGVKPFYYFSTRDYFAFASDEEAFLGLEGFAGEPNENFIAGNLIGFDVGDIRTESWLKDVLKIPAGSRLTVDKSGRHSVQSYWQLEPMEELEFGSDRDCEEAFLAVFADSIRCRLDGCVDTALMLSGGIDSAGIAAVARRVLARSSPMRLKTFSVVSEQDLSCTESANIRGLAKAFTPDARLFSIENEKNGFADVELQAVAWDRAHPIANSILIPALMYRAARSAGARVMFDGIHGDAVTGTDFFYMTDLLRVGAWRTAWRESRLARERNAQLLGLSPLTIFAKSACDAYAPDALKALKRHLSKAMRPGFAHNSVIDRVFARDLRLGERYEERCIQSLRLQSRSLQERHIRALMPEIPWAMEGFDMVAAQYGMEASHPWSDRRLVEFCLRLPLRQKARDGYSKFILRKTVAPSLGQSIAWHKDKGHLGIEVVRRLMGRSHEQIELAVELAKNADSRYVNADGLRKLHHRWKANRDDNDMYQLFSVISLLLWTQRIRENASEARAPVASRVQVAI